MLTGEYHNIEMASIEVDRENRQRSELSDIEELAESIRRHGQIHPIVVTREHKLVAGERRYSAVQLLRWDYIAAQYIDEVSDEELQIIELEENIRRADLSWQDETRAIAKYHGLRKASADQWSTERTAEELKISRSNVERHLQVAQMMDAGVPEVLEAPKFSTAHGFASRKIERQKAAALRDLTTSLAPTPAKEEPEILGTVPPPPTRYMDIQQADFLSWSQTVREDAFNLIHCDFPYGVNAGDKIGQSGAKSYGGYEDGFDIYEQLLAALLENQDNFIHPSAHMIFWFSMDHYEYTRKTIQSTGWRVDPFPFIWHKSDNNGIIPDANRGPRRTYETAFFCTRGDRKIVKPVSNSVAAAATPRAERIHMSEKPRVMLSHFFRMLIDESTVMLDPTCGSGNSVAVAEELGARYSLGLELNPDYVQLARERNGL